MDSISNQSLWLNPGGEKVRDYTVHQSIDGSLAIRQGDFKLEMCPGSGGWSYPTAEETKNLPSFQLYNLKDDIGETKNVIEKYPDVYLNLRSKLKEIVENGRSTRGPRQENNGDQVWDTVLWLMEK